MMREDWMTLKLDLEKDVMMKRVRTARRIVICAYIIIALGVIAAIVFPYFGLSIRRLTNLTDRGRPLPLQTYYFYDTDKSPKFELTYLTQVIMMFISTIIYTSVDGFFGLAVLHTCRQLENFRYRLINLMTAKVFNNAL